MGAELFRNYEAVEAQNECNWVKLRLPVSTTPEDCSVGHNNKKVLN